ncbi:MAG: ribonuclease III [Anaerolineae bacterium]|jgi:ribonuclease-3
MQQPPNHHNHEAAPDDIAALERALGLSFHDLVVLQQALTHSSFVNELPGDGIGDNQRLEFLGDAILDFVVGEWLFSRYPDAREGELTSLRAEIVRTEGLAAFARILDLGRYLRLGRGEASTGGREREANLCAAFEALVGAVFVDQGMDVVLSLVHGLLEQRAPEIDAQRQVKDAKSLLQELTQGRLRLTPAYRVVGEHGPDHAKVFSAQVLVGDDVWGAGAGRSKQAAEQAAARNALQAFRTRTGSRQA